MDIPTMSSPQLIRDLRKAQNSCSLRLDAASMKPMELTDSIISQARNIRRKDAAKEPDPLSTRVFSELAGVSESLASTSIPPEECESCQLFRRTRDVQQRYQAEHQDMQCHLEKLGTHLEKRMSSLEERLSTFENRSVHMDRQQVESNGIDSSNFGRSWATWVSETQALMGGVVSHAAQLEDVSAKSESNCLKLQHIERNSKVQQDRIQLLEIELQRMQVNDPCSLVNKIEAALSMLNGCRDEQEAVLEDTAIQLRADCQDLWQRCEQQYGELHTMVIETNARLEEQLSFVAGLGQIARADLQEKEGADVISQISETIAASAARLDIHEGRLETFSEHIDAACSQVSEDTRQMVHQLRQDVVSEVECQLNILRRRFEATSELCEELSVREFRKVPTVLPQRPCAKKISDVGEAASPSHR